MSWEGGEGSHLGDKALGLTNPFLSKLNDISGLELPMRGWQSFRWDGAKS